MEFYKQAKEHNLFPCVPIFHEKKIVDEISWKGEANEINKDTIDDLGEHFTVQTENGVQVKRITGLALKCGEKSNIMVIDLDIGHNDKNGVEEFNKLIDKLDLDKDKIYNTYTVVTPRGGKHLYYKYKKGLPNSSSTIGIDIRTTGGLAPIAGSCANLEYGRENTYYKVEKEVPIAEINQSLFDCLVDLFNDMGNGNSVTGGKNDFYRTLGSGERNTMVYKYACKKAVQVGTSIELLNEVQMYNSTYCEPPLAEDEVENIVNSALKYLQSESEFIKEDDKGMYKFVLKGKGDDVTEERVDLSNFKFLSCKLNSNVDTNYEDAEFKLENSRGDKEILSTKGRNVFTDPKTFRNFLPLKFTYKGNATDIIEIQDFVMRTKLESEIKAFMTTGLRNIEDEMVVITQNGMLHKDGTYDPNLNATDNHEHMVDYTGLTKLTKEDCERLYPHLINFNSIENVVCELGWSFAAMLNGYVREIDSRLPRIPILQIMGESASGKSKATDILRAIYCNNQGSKQLGASSPVAFDIALANTYFPIWVDEVKPSKIANKKLVTKISDISRAVTENYVTSKATRELGTKEYPVRGTLVLIGEEGLNEVAVNNRSIIVRHTRTHLRNNPTGAKSVAFLSSDEGIELLHKLGFTAQLYILNNINLNVLTHSFKENAKMFEKYRTSDNERRFNVFNWVTLGFDLMISILESTGYTVPQDIKDNYPKYIYDVVLKEDEDDDSNLAEYEKVLQTMDYLIVKSDPTYQLTRGVDYAVKDDVDGWYFAFTFKPVMDKIEQYYGGLKHELPINRDDFKKTLLKSTYCIGGKTKLVRLNNGTYSNGVVTKQSKPVRCICLKVDELEKLGLENIPSMIEDELEESHEETTRTKRKHKRD